MFDKDFSSPLRRLDLALQVLCLTLGVLVLLSLPLWWSERTYPTAPCFSWIPVFPVWVHNVLAACFIALPFIMLLTKHKRILSLIYIILYILFVLQDQNRLQPYYYQLFFLMALICLPGKVSRQNQHRQLFGLLSLVLFGTYLWAGIHKINPYFQERYASMGSGYWMPALEIAMALGLLWPRTRRTAVELLVLMHLTLAIVFSPLCYDWNTVVIPWNLALATLSVLVFWRAEEPGIQWFKPSGTAVQPLVILLFVLLPALNFAGLWDHYLSFSLYSSKVPYVKIYLDDAHQANLPENIKKYVYEDRNGSYVEVTYWAMGETRTAPYPEHRVNEQVRRYLCSFSPDKDCTARLVYYR
jgi:hypothetical protein